jgi:hypothetical protein
VPRGRDAGAKLWSIDGAGDVDALRAVAIETDGAKGFAVAFRRAGAIWVGAAVGDPLAPKGELVKLASLGTQVGAPALAASGNTLHVAWADRAATSDPWSLRLARLAIGDATADASNFPAPAGGLGSNLMSPGIAAVGADRFLLAWTEGPVAAHQVRAQTLDAQGKAVGDPLTISPATLNAGQPQPAVLADGRGLVAFVAQAGDARRRTYDVMASQVACGAR